jgi:hypothetical protein
MLPATDFDRHAPDFNRSILLSANSGRHGEVEKNSGRWRLSHCRRCFSTEHGITEQLTRAGQLFPPAFPPLVRNRQVQQFHGTVEGLS